MKGIWRKFRKNVQNALKIIFVEHIDEVMKIAFVQDEEDIGAPSHGKCADKFPISELKGY